MCESLLDFSFKIHFNISRILLIKDMFFHNVIISVIISKYVW